MDWNLFWNAFGAIGTTVGSLVTAIAVLIAVKQNKQPLEKRIEVTHGMSFPIFDDKIGTTQVHIVVQNLGIREMSISGFYLSNGKMKFYLNGMQSDIQRLNLPCVLKPEESVSFFINYEKFKTEIKRLASDKNIRNKEKLKVCIQDSLGQMHYDKKIIKYNKGKIK